MRVYPGLIDGLVDSCVLNHIADFKIHSRVVRKQFIGCQQPLHDYSERLSAMETLITDALQTMPHITNISASVNEAN